MSTAESVILHLTQQPLNGGDKDILAGLVDWVSKANFADQYDKTFNVCADDERPNKWELLKEMELIKTVGYSLPIVRNPADIQLPSIRLVNGR